MTAPSDHWLAQRLVRALAPDLQSTAGTAALADLDFEVSAADHAAARARARLAGHAALLRLFICHGLSWRPLMRRALLVLALGLLGSGWVFVMLMVSNNGRVHLLPYLGMLVIAPLLLSFWDPNRSYRSTMLSCSAIGLLMTATQAAWARSGKPPLSWLAALLLASVAVLVVIGFSALAAAVACRATSARGQTWRSAVIQAAVGAGFFIPAYVLNYLVFFQNGRRFDGWPLIPMAGYLGLTFGIVALLVHVPLMRVVRRLGHARFSRFVLPALGVALFPVPLLLPTALQHQTPLLAAWRHFVGDPTLVMTVSLPYVIAGAVVGILSSATAAADVQIARTTDS